jgi:hypothetical protein
VFRARNPDLLASNLNVSPARRGRLELLVSEPVVGSLTPNA